MSIFSKNATYLKNICSTRTFRNTHGSNKSGKLHRRKNCGEEKKTNNAIPGLFYLLYTISIQKPDANGIAMP